MASGPEDSSIKQKEAALRSTRKTVIVQAVIIGSILIIAAAVTVFGVSGMWPFAVAVESDSMSPNLNVGDLVFIVQKDRASPVVTAEEAQVQGNLSFGGYGDVIVYTPNGNTHTTAFIHRVISQMNATQAVEKYGFSPEWVEGGYITKGDNNNREDQTLAFNGIGRMYPVREEWVVGKAVAVIPLVGFIPMYIWQIAVFVLAVLLLWEWYSKRIERKEKRAEEEKK